MPEVSGGGREGVVPTRSVGVKRVELAGAVTSENDRPGVKILNRKTKRVKLNGNRVITS